MKRTLIRRTALVGLFVIIAPALAAAQGRPIKGHWGENQLLRLHAGVFTPRGESNYWADKELDFFGSADDFEDTIVGVDYIRLLGGRLGLITSLTSFEGSADQSYLDFVDETGAEIFHSTDLDIATFSLGLIWNFSRRDARIVPYLGVGAGFHSWTLRETGDFIDFDTPGLDIFFGSFEQDGTAIGMYWQAGLEVPLASNWSIFADARWQRAEDDLEGDFAGLGELDLSGRSITFGGAVSF